MVYVAPVYAAGEAADRGRRCGGAGRRPARRAATARRSAIAGPDALADELAAHVEPGDMVICLGAGDITKWAAGLADAIEAAQSARHGAAEPAGRAVA